MTQDYYEGEVYENLVQEVLKFYDIDLKIYSYKKNPEMQNIGIDAKIINPPKLNGITIQVKMFRNSEKYQTFPWEVARYLVNEKKFVYEPHKADYHILIDPIENQNVVKCVIWIIKTGALPNYFKDLWIDAINKFGEPHRSNPNWTIKQGKIEPYFYRIYKNETLYQLMKKHTASQKNVRFKLNRLKKKFLKFQFNIPTNLLHDIELEQYDRLSYIDSLKKINTQKIKVTSFFEQNN